MTGILVRSSCEDTERPQEGKSYVKGGRDSRDGGTSQKSPWISGNHQKLGEKQQMVLPLQPPEGSNPAEAMISNLWPLEL